MKSADHYADSLATQLRKGFLVYCMLRILSAQSLYTGDIIKCLRGVNIAVVEGTIYPMLNRMQRDGLLTHEWQESEQGPPRKYYLTTDHGKLVAEYIAKDIQQFNNVFENI